MSKKRIFGAIAATLLLLVAGSIFYLVWRAGGPSATWARLKQNVTGAPAPASAGEKEAAIDYWTCTMHPSVKMKGPGKCPICGMDLVPVLKSPDKAPEKSSDQPQERSTFSIDPRRQQLINVQTTTAEFRRLEKEIRAVGIVALDETLIERVHPKISGWVDRVFVDFTLQHVHKGDPLFSVYSPELVATQEEYLLAVKTVKELAGSPFEHVSSGALSLLEATRRRLQLLDITDEQLRELESSGRIQKNVVVYSPASGHVLERNAFPNMRVTPETHLYTIASHARVWVQVQIDESDIPYIRQGQAAEMTTSAYPADLFQGRISYVYPHMDDKTRTMKARLEFANPRLKLKPEMYAEVRIRVPLGKQLTVPQSAVLRTGKRDLVFVDLGEGKMQLREVQLGVKVGEFYQLLAGLQAGEKVVSSGNFLVDAESKVQGIEAAWEQGQQPAHRH